MLKRADRLDIPEFWSIADEMIAAGLADQGTMMGHPCLRVAGAFFATVGHDADELIVKLPGARVQELIDGGVGVPFVPAGRRFREWVAIQRDHHALWPELVREAHRFVAASAGAALPRPQA